MENELQIQATNLMRQFTDAAKAMEAPDFKDPAEESYVAGVYATIEHLSNNPSEMTIMQASISMLFLSGFLEKQKIATIDSLTEVDNVFSFERDLSSALVSHHKAIDYERKHQVTRAVAIVDLDYFKDINDNLGHVAGDKALKKMAQTLDTTSRTEEAVYRIGGDEFALILEDHDPDNGKENIQTAIKRFEDAVSELTIEYNGQERPLLASIGYHIINDNDQTAEQVKNLADKGCYKSKEKKDERQEKVWAIIEERQNPTNEPS